MPIIMGSSFEPNITSRAFGGIAIDTMRQVLYISDIQNGQILRINYVPFIYEEYHHQP